MSTQKLIVQLSQLGFAKNKIINALNHLDDVHDVNRIIEYMLKDEDEKKYDMDNEESDDEYQECIINPGNDRRMIICDTQNKYDGIIQCIGTLETHYIPDPNMKQTEIVHGTGTVIHIDKNNLIYVLSAAHNICASERKCKKCNTKTLKIKCPNKLICKSGRNTIKTGNLIEPKDIYFLRRGNGIKHKLGQCIERYQVEHYKIPQIYYKLWKPRDGYDMCIIVFKCHDKYGINLYKENCSKISLATDKNFGGNECVLYIYGYPGEKREEKDHRIYYYLYGMGTSKIDKDSRCKIAANNKGKLYIVNKGID
eukprot:158640_1